MIVVYAVNLIVILVLLYLVFWLASMILAAVFGAPTVYANDKAIFDAYNLAKLQKDELVVDLGCGDAKSLIIAAKEFGATGVGVERSPYAYLISKYRVWRAGEKNRIKIILGDFKKAEGYLKTADVVYLYLLNSVLKEIEGWFFVTVTKKTRIVSLAFSFHDHRPQKEIETLNLGLKTKLRLYRK